MTRLRSALVTGALAAAAIVGGLAATTTTASAEVACNRWGECWRVHQRYTTYPVRLGVVIHDDAWWDAQRHHRHWRWRRDRDDDHGYYSHGRWRQF
jgi:hypothetical protein